MSQKKTHMKVTFTHKNQHHTAALCATLTDAHHLTTDSGSVSCGLCAGGIRRLTGDYSYKKAAP